MKWNKWNGNYGKLTWSLNDIQFIIERMKIEKVKKLVEWLKLIKDE